METVCGRSVHGASAEVLERAGTTESRRMLTTLATGAPGSRLTLDAKAALNAWLK